MKVALVSPAIPSIVGEAVDVLLEPLREHLDVELFLPPGDPSQSARPVTELRAKEFERILFPIADEPACAVSLPLIARFGGTVLLFDWELATLACAAYPALQHGGALGFLRALREGGLREARAWSAGRAGPRPAVVAFNRSVVRRGDSFIVQEEELRARITNERNSPTPIGVVPPTAEMLADPTSAARLIAELLRAAPPHRSGRKSLLRDAIDTADAARRMRDEARS